MTGPRRRPQPIDQESEYAVEELFFSITDTRGIIKTGNSVFYRVSGYSKTDLIGAPHNIIRHPDVPRAVFKLLWDTIQAGKPIGAYVKNMAIDGSYYWVFAIVTPIENGYLSVRLKPTTSLFSVVQDVYKSALKAEATGGMDAGLADIVGHLTKAGFSGYEEFMAKALSAELKSREAQTAQGKAWQQFSNPASQELERTRSLCQFGQRSFGSTEGLIEKFRRLDVMLEERVSGISEGFRKLTVLSINMALSATHIGKSAATLAVIADEFQDSSREVQGQLVEFKSWIARIKDMINKTEFSVGLARAQLSMTEFFINEMNSLNNENGEGAEKEYLENCRELVFQANASTDLATQLMRELLTVLRGFGGGSRELETSATGLEIIRQTGKIETVQLAEGAETVEPYIQEMERFLLRVRKPMREVTQQAEALENEVKTAIEAFFKAGDGMAEGARIIERLIKQARALSIKGVKKVSAAS